MTADNFAAGITVVCEERPGQLRSRLPRAIVLFLGVADWNALVFCRARMGFGISFSNETARNRAAVNRFGWYSFYHWVEPLGWLYSPWLMVKRASQVLVFEAPEPSGAQISRRDLLWLRDCLKVGKQVAKTTTYCVQRRIA
jgi:hypothetical protein